MEVPTCRVGQAWTEEEDAALLYAYGSGLNIIEIAPIAGRFSKSVAMRLVSLGAVTSHEDARGWDLYEQSGFAKDPQVEALLAVQRQETADRKQRERDARKQEVAAKKQQAIEDRNRKQAEEREMRKREQAARRDAKAKLRQERKQLAKEAREKVAQLPNNTTKDKRKYERKKPINTAGSDVSTSGDVNTANTANTMVHQTTHQMTRQMTHQVTASAQQDPRDVRIKQLEDMVRSLSVTVDNILAANQ